MLLYYVPVSISISVAPCRGTYDRQHPMFILYIKQKACN